MLSLCDFQSGHQEVSFTEPLYSKVHESGKLVMQNADPITQEQIESELAGIQRRWAQMLHHLSQREETLEEVLKEWQQTEDVMDELLGWLKDMRLVLGQDLPDNYDDLQRELHRCKVRSSFEVPIVYS